MKSSTHLFYQFLMKLFDDLCSCLQVDLPTIITDKLIKAALAHLDVHLRAKRKGENI